MAHDTANTLIDWAIGCVRYFIARHGLRLTQQGGQLSDLYVGLDEIGATLGGRRAHDLPAEWGLDAAEPPGPPPADAGSPLGLIAARFGLDDADVAILAALLAPALSVDVARLYRFAWADFTVKAPPVSFICELLGGDPAERAARFRPDAPLRAGGLITLKPSESWGGPRAADVYHSVALPGPVLAFVRGEPPRAQAFADVYRPHDAGPAFQPGEGLMHAIRRFRAAEARRVLISGPAGSGRSEAVRAVCRGRDESLVLIDPARLPGDDFEVVLGEALLDARLHGLVVLLRGDAIFGTADDIRAAAIERHLARYEGPVLVSVPPQGHLPPGLRHSPMVSAPRPDRRTQHAAWQAALDDPALATRMSSRFDVTLGVLHAAVRDGRRDAALSPAGQLTEGILTRALRRGIQHALDGLSDPVETTLDWHDVVLPDEVVESLREIRAHARHRIQVFDVWGFRRKMSYGRGLACLFSGPPGTGKTMMAGILARDLGREMYRVDLSRVVSKWVGETEKNLGRIFDEAQKAQVILFFDEADSLFSTRTEVKGANDRFANMEVNYLLQRMEQYDGVSILTTNFQRGLDDAFLRRLKFKVHFPMPDADQRAELWQRMIPDEMPTADEIDFARLGKRFKMSGGNIKNAVLRAAFYVAETGGELTTARLQKAAESELREMGRL